MKSKNIRISTMGQFRKVNFPLAAVFSTLVCTFLLLANSGFSQVYNPKNSTAVRPPIDYTAISKEAFEPGVFRVKFSAGVEKSLGAPSFATENGVMDTGIPGFDQVCNDFGVHNGVSVLELAYRSLPNKSVSPEITERHRQWGFHLWYEFTLDEGQDIQKVLLAMNALGSVEFAEPVFRVELLEMMEEGEPFRSSSDAGSKALNIADGSNDPKLSDQWSFYNYGQNGGTPGVDIGLVNAWAIERGNPGVIVAIIDGGVNTAHPDLEANLWTDENGHHGYNFANDTYEFFPSNHATHVAGTVAAVTNNGIGVSGIAGGSGTGDGVRIMNCQVFGDSRTGGFHLAPLFAADNGAAISQNSWSYSSPEVYDQLALDAIDYFNTYGGGNVLDGGITIFAAGNRGKEENIYPACYSGTLSVASTNSMDIKALNSTFGDWVDLSAPGVGIVSTIGSDAYGSSSGTSMASPHVAGVAALIISMAPGQLTAQQVIDIIKETAQDHYPQNPSFAGKLGAGRLNASGALSRVNELLGNQEPEEVPDYFFLVDGDWNDQANWSTDQNHMQNPDHLPGASSQMHIMARATSTTGIKLASAGSIAIYGNGELSAPELDLTEHTSDEAPITILPGGRLSIATIEAAESNAPIRILSDEQGSGSFIHHSGSINALVEHYLEGQNERFHMLSSPTTGQTINAEFAGGSFHGWHEPGQAWVGPANPAEFPAWQEANNGSNELIPGKGYMASYSYEKQGDRTKTFSGTLNSGDYRLNLSNKATGLPELQGFNFVGNPYPSAIDWKATIGWSGRNNLKTNGGLSEGFNIWIWNPESGNYGAYNSMGSSDAGTNGASRYIQPKQAFWVRAIADDEMLTVNNEARLHVEPGMLKDEGSLSGIRLVVHGTANTYNDEVIIEFGHNNDQGGAEKMFSMIPEAPALYAPKQDTPFSISFLDQAANHRHIPLGFQAGVDATYTISAEGLMWFDEAVYLLDLHTGTQHKLSQTPSYTFSARTGDEPDRFLIQFGEETTTSAPWVESIDPKIFTSNGNLHIENPWHEETSVQIFTLTGAAVTGIERISRGTSQQTLTITPGIYIVRLARQGQVFTEKVFVGKV